MPKDFVIQRTASVEQRVDAVRAALDERGIEPTETVEQLRHLAEEEWLQNGKRVVARAWIDPEFRKRLLANGREAVDELGVSMPKHHRRLVVLENTPAVQNVICCTLCSCTAYTIIGLPPDGSTDCGNAGASGGNVVISDEPDADISRRPTRQRRPTERPKYRPPDRWRADS